MELSNMYIFSVILIGFILQMHLVNARDTTHKRDTGYNHYDVQDSSSSSRPAFITTEYHQTQERHGSTRCADPLSGMDLDEESCQELCMNLWRYSSGQCENGKCECSDSPQILLARTSPSPDENFPSDDDSSDDEDQQSPLFNRVQRILLVAKCHVTYFKHH